MPGHGHKHEGGLVEAARDTSHYRDFSAYIGALDAGYYFVAVRGEVLVANPGVEVSLSYAVPQGINPAALLLHIEFYQRPGLWPQVQSWKSVDFTRIVTTRPIYSEAEIVSGEVMVVRVPFVGRAPSAELRVEAASPNIAVYAGGPLGPDAIAANFLGTQSAGWTTIILGLFHIGRPDIPGQAYGDIIFGGAPMVIHEGQWMLPNDDWPQALSQLKSGGSISRIYASFGGGGPVYDYTTLQKIYAMNGNSFAGTQLEANFRLFRSAFPAIDGIDLDCEDLYDPASFVAFCEMLADIGFSLTFCPYTNPIFWAQALASLNVSRPGAVKWWNLQCYAGGYGQDPAAWAAQIAASVPGFDTDGFILAGDWTNDGLGGVEALIAGLSKEPCLGGGFLWNLDGVLQAGPDQAPWANAIRTGFGRGPSGAAGAARPLLAT